MVYAFTNELEEWLRRPQPPVDTSKSDAGTACASRLTRCAYATMLSKEIPSRVSDEKPPSGVAPRPARQSSALDSCGSAGHCCVCWHLFLPADGPLCSQGRRRSPTPATGILPSALIPLPCFLSQTSAEMPATDYLSDGITEALIGNLAHVPQLKVRPRDSVFRYKGKDLDLKTIGTNLGVSVLVTGRVMAQGNTIEISAELTNVRDNAEIWGRHYTGKNTDIVSLQQQLAGDIADKLRSTLSSAEKQNVTNQGTQDPRPTPYT